MEQLVFWAIIILDSLLILKKEKSIARNPYTRYLIFIQCIFFLPIRLAAKLEDIYRNLILCGPLY